MKKTAICLFLSSLAAANTWAKNPNSELSQGSSTTQITVSVSGAGSCAVESPLVADLVLEGELSLATTRHGNNGAVHELAMTAEFGSSTTYLAKSSAFAAAQASVDTGDLTAEANVSDIFDYYDKVWELSGSGTFYYYELILGLDIDIEVQAEAYATAIASADSAAQASAEAEVAGESVVTTNSTLLVRGANIQAMESGLTVSALLADAVNTSAIADTYANALASATAFALAREVANAQLSGEGEACVKTFLGPLCITIPPFDFNVPVEIAKVIEDNGDAIREEAQQRAESATQALLTASVEVNVRAVFENLPGKDDRLELVAEPTAFLTCE